MRMRLEPRWIKPLCELPESGMGYHRVDVLTGGAAEGEFHVIADLLEVLAEGQPQDNLHAIPPPS